MGFFDALYRHFRPGPGKNLQPVTHPSGTAGAPVDPYDLATAVQETSEMPPFPGPLDTRGIDGMPYAQLHADLQLLVRHVDAGKAWDALDWRIRYNLWRQYPEYLMCATRQRVMTAAAYAAIRTQPQAWLYFVRRWGDPQFEMRRRMEWFLLCAEARP